MKVPFYRHQLPPSMSSHVAEVLATPFLTSGQVGRRVEAQLCDFFDLPHAKLTNSWTNGAVAALLALGVGEGDEVIVPAMTFIASANVVELVGARPVFVDVDPQTLLVTADGVAAALSDRTRAVIPVHLYGQLADVEAIRAAVGPDVAILEDCAHAFEATLRGDRPGRHADCAIFSFYATKNVTCGEGGAFVTGRPDLAEAFAQTMLHGMSAGAVDRFAGGSYRHWDMHRLGTKANLPDLLAALLPPQIEAIASVRAQREALAARYQADLAGAPGLRWPTLLPGACSAHHLFPIHVGRRRRDRILAALSAAEIGATVNYNPVPLTSFYRQRYGFDEGSFPVATDWGLGTLSLPLYPGMPEPEREYTVRTLRGLLDG